MYNSNIDIDKLINDNLPNQKRKLNIFSFLNVLLNPFKMIYESYLLAKEEYIYKVAFNGQVDMLEHILNDTFDNVNRDIFITQRGLVDIHYSFNMDDFPPEIYSYYIWDSSKSYSIGDKVNYNNVIYNSIQNANVNNLPDELASLYWEEVQESDFVRYLSEYNMSAGFIVNVPNTITLDETRLRAIIEYYKLAGRPYEIIYF